MRDMREMRNNKALRRIPKGASYGYYENYIWKIK